MCWFIDLLNCWLADENTKQTTNKHTKVDRIKCCCFFSVEFETEAYAQAINGIFYTQLHTVMYGEENRIKHRNAKSAKMNGIWEERKKNTS